jgi:hypothetical protein
MVAKSASKDRARDRTQDEDRSETESTSIPSPRPSPRPSLRRKIRRGQPKTEAQPSEDEDHSVSTTSALANTEAKTKTPNPAVKVRLRRFFSRKSPKNPKSPRPSTFDILEDLSMVEDIITRSSSRLSRKSIAGNSYAGNSQSTDDYKSFSGTTSFVGNLQSTDDDYASALGRNVEDALEHREDGSISITSRESEEVEAYDIVKTPNAPNSWSDRVKDSRRYWVSRDPTSPRSLGEAQRRGLLSPVPESMGEDEKSNATGRRTSNDQPEDNAEESPWKSDTTDYRDENLEGSRNNSLRDDCPRDDSPRGETTYLTEEDLEDCLSSHATMDDIENSLSRNERELHGTLTSGTEATYNTTETTKLTVEQLKRDLELFSLDGVAENMLPTCQQSGTGDETNRNHSTVHKNDHVFPSKPWCYSSEQGEYLLEDRSEAPGSDRMFGCMPLPELYPPSRPTRPTHYRDSNVENVAQVHGHPGMNIMSDITSYAISEASTGYSSDDSSTLLQSDIGLDDATSGHTTFTEDSESLSIQTGDELSHTDDDDFTQIDSEGSVSTAPENGQFLSWLGSPVSSNSDSDSDSSSVVESPNKETKDPGLFQWLHGN